MPENNSNQSDNNQAPVMTDTVMQQVADKIERATSVLVALSKEPSIDEIAAAIGLTMIFNAMGKRATALYSGEVPAALDFLHPEKVLQKNTSSLQDFVITISRNKIEGMRYDYEGDNARVYIVPSQTNLSSDDLSFSYGEYNVELVIGINLASNESLDAAFSDYGRIMRDAESVNITNGALGRFCEIEWGSAEASSVSEMIYDLAEYIGASHNITNEIATALLTGVVASTDRFLNEKTTPNTMKVASALMQLGANQKMIADEISKGESSVKVAEPIEAGEAEMAEANVAEPSAAPARDSVAGPSAEAELEQMLMAEPSAAPAKDNVAGPSAEAELEQMLMAEPATPAVSAAELTVEPVVPVVEPTVSVPAPVAPVAEPVQVAEPVIEEKPVDYSERIEAELAEPVYQAPVMPQAVPVMQPMPQPIMPEMQPQAMSQPMMQPVDAALPVSNIPEFGMMPPEDVPSVMPVMPQMAPGVEAIPVGVTPTPVAELNPVVVQPETMGAVDPSAFKIPGM